MNALASRVSNMRTVELGRPQTDCANSRRGLTLNQGLVDWRATVNGTRTCSIDDCNRPPRSGKQPLCETHYYRVRRTGTPYLVARVPSEWAVCGESGCGKLARTRGGAQCTMHYKRERNDYTTKAQTRADRDATMRRLYESGLSTIDVGAQLGLDPSHVSRVLRSIGVTMRPFGGAGEDHPLWAGDNPTYSGAHMRVRAQRGKASAYSCACGKTAKQWAYLHNDPNELDSELGPYSADPDRYEAMCVPCHKRFDLARLK